MIKDEIPKEKESNLFLWQIGIIGILLLYVAVFFGISIMEGNTADGMCQDLGYKGSSDFDDNTVTCIRQDGTLNLMHRSLFYGTEHGHR